MAQNPQRYLPEPTEPRQSAYRNSHEYILVLSKGNPKNIPPLAGSEQNGRSGQAWQPQTTEGRRHVSQCEFQCSSHARKKTTSGSMIPVRVPLINMPCSTPRFSRNNWRQTVLHHGAVQATSCWIRCAAPARPARWPACSDAVYIGIDTSLEYITISKRRVGLPTTSLEARLLRKEGQTALGDMV